MPKTIRLNATHYFIMKIPSKSNNKIDENKAQYNLDRQTAEISTLSSGNVSR